MKVLKVLNRFGFLNGARLYPRFNLYATFCSEKIHGSRLWSTEQPARAYLALIRVCEYKKRQI